MHFFDSFQKSHDRVGYRCDCTKRGTHNEPRSFHSGRILQSKVMICLLCVSVRVRRAFGLTQMTKSFYDDLLLVR